MRFFKEVLFGLMVVFMVSCDDEETNVQKYYEGGWLIESADPAVDSVANIFISKEGNFEYLLNYGSQSLTVTGRVTESGEIEGNIELQNLLLGVTTGQLGQTGSGTGLYTIANQEFEWVTTKK